MPPAPGEFPYTRGIHASTYKGKLWTMRQFSGFSTPEATNRRYRYLLRQGQTGLSVAFDSLTLMGLDADDANSAGEVGKCGVPVSSIEDGYGCYRVLDTAHAAIPSGPHGRCGRRLCVTSTAQQVLAHETGVTIEPDPLGGSYYVERLTDAMEVQAWEIIGEIDEMGGMIPAIDRADER